MNDFNTLIIYLMAIYGKAKDIHYTCGGPNFYGDHLFADRIANGINEFIDQIKETCLLGHGEKPLFAYQYFKEVDKLLNMDASFASLLDLITNCLAHIEQMQNLSRGDGQLLDSIAGKLQNDKGLLEIMFRNY